MERAVEEASVTGVQSLRGPILPLKSLTQGPNIQARVKLANERTSAGTQRLPSEVESGPRLLWCKPIQDIGQMDKIESFRQILKRLCHASNCPNHFGHARWRVRVQPRIHDPIWKPPLQHLPQIRVVPGRQRS